eukprot:4568315-Lingulodinium_polyedra.AAC.1
MAPVGTCTACLRRLLRKKAAVGRGDIYLCRARWGRMWPVGEDEPRQVLANVCGQIARRRVGGRADQ